MSEAVIVALIAAGASLIGTILTVKSGNNKLLTEMRTHNAVQDEQIKNLTEETRKHNSFGERIPRIEARIDAMDTRISSIERREMK